MTGFSTARQYMVDGQVRTSDVTDIRILDAMLAVPREDFVPDNKQALDYLDLDLDVSEGGAAKRCLIAPAVLAKMLQAAEIK
jgi:protein-L-isoaspartate(D-aspartate) O-methyltransferase